MKNTTKALLLSILVFPGTGQYVLKRYKTATLFIVTSLILIIFIVIDIFKKASVIVDKIIAEGIEAELFAIRRLLAAQQDTSQWISILIYTLVAVWLISIINIFCLNKEVLK